MDARELFREFPIRPDDESKVKKREQIERNRNNIPPINNLPEGKIDWEEISLFILNGMARKYVSLDWNVLNDSDKTKKLPVSSLTVLKSIKYDLYEYFFHHEIAFSRSEQWEIMEKYIRIKYHNLSENALSRLISNYHVNDR